MMTLGSKAQTELPKSIESLTANLNTTVDELAEELNLTGSVSDTHTHRFQFVRIKA